MKEKRESSEVVKEQRRAMKKKKHKKHKKQHTQTLILVFDDLSHPDIKIWKKKKGKEIVGI